MRPYIHLIHELDNGTPGKSITTITGKAAFRRWVMNRYFEESGSPVCFRLEGEGQFYEVLPFVYMKGKNKGKDRVVFSRMRPDDGRGDADDIPFWIVDIEISRTE